MAKSFDFQHAPGYLIRRAHQLAVAVFTREMAEFEVTPVQFAILNALMDTPGEDQVTLAGRVAFDAATSGSVILRLEGRGLVRRQPDEADRRRKLLWITPEGEALVQRMKKVVAQSQYRITDPLTDAERAQFLSLLSKLVAGHESNG